LTVEATDDRDREKLGTGTISHTASSDDPNYDGIDISELIVNVSDNDNKGANKNLATSESISVVNMTEEDDTVTGSSEKNIIYAKNGNDRLAGEAGNDFLYGKEGADGIDGGDGDDMIYGGSGEDYIRGDRGKDTLFGSEGSDRLFGGDGNDRIFGDEGNDYIEGNAGSDTLTGNSGSDAFAIDLQTGVANLSKLDEIDLITDFDPQQDRIDIGTMTFKEINLISGVGNFAGSSVIQNAQTQDYLAVLIDVNSNSLDSNNFI
jgi:Ca2+-binding RTX toxin-like protein